MTRKGTATDGGLRSLYRIAAGHLRDASPKSRGGRRLRLDTAFLPVESPDFARSILDDFARFHGLPTWETFRTIHASPEPEKPRRPNNEIVDFEIRKRKYYGEKAALFREWFTRTLLDDYILAYADYEKEAARRNAIVQNHPLCALGYISFFCAENPRFRSFFFDRYRKLPISENARERHTYITGGTGSGKTEAIKVLIHHYVARHKTAVVILEPHGVLADQVAHWREFRDDPERLVYIDPAIDPEHITPVFNPLDIPDGERTPSGVLNVAAQIVEVFREILADVGFTLNMETTLLACVSTLLLRKGSTFRDLHRFMDDTQNADLVAFAKKNLTGALRTYREFFETRFLTDSLKSSKDGIGMRLFSFLPGFFEQSTVGRSTFDLEGALKARKVVVFHLSKSKLKQREVAIFGRFIIARIKAFAFKQGRISEERKRTPVHVFVDECQNFLTPSIEEILCEARKFRVHLTLAQQIIGQGMDKRTEQIVLANTGVKMTGKNARHTIEIIAKETGAPMDELESLKVGEFHVKSGDRKSVKARMPAHLLGDKGAMTPEEWERVKADQIARYYRRIGEEPRSAEASISPSPALPFPIDE